MHGYNFTERVRKVLALAREESARLRHEYVGTEHILLAIIREGKGVAATVLQNLGIDLGELELRIERVVKRGHPGTPTGPELPYTSRAKKVLELAMTQARELNNDYVGTEHLLLGLIAESKGIAAQVLVDSGVTLDKAQEETLRVLQADNPKAARAQQTTAPTTSAGGIQVPAPAMSDRMRDVIREAESVARQADAPRVMPIHIAVALLRNGEGFANAVLDRLNIDRAGLLQALTNEAKNSASAPDDMTEVNVGHYMAAFQQQVESEARWRQSAPSTLHMLLALLDNAKNVARIFETQGIDTARIRSEASRMHG